MTQTRNKKFILPQKPGQASQHNPSASMKAKKRLASTGCFNADLVKQDLASGPRCSYEQAVSVALSSVSTISKELLG